MPDDHEYQPTKMVVCGGGPKGRGYKPVIRMLQEVGIMDGITDTYGSSVGALLSGAVSMGLSPNDIDRFLDANPKVFQDAFQTEPSMSRIRAPKRYARNLFSTKAAFKGDGLFQQAQSLVASSGALGPNATMAELKALVDAGAVNPNTGLNYKNLHVTATIEDPRGSYQIIIDAQTAPNMPIALAMRMSAALPGAFPAVVLTQDELRYYTNGATKPLVQYERGYPYTDDSVEATNKDGSITCVDGGLVDNLPQYLVQDEGSPNPDVISLNLEHPNYYQFRQAQLERPTISAEQYDEAVAVERQIGAAEEDAFLNGQDLSLYHQFKRELKKRKEVKLPPSRLLVSDPFTVHINSGDVTAFTFNMTPEQHQHLVLSGYTAISDLLSSQGVDLSNVSPPPEDFAPAEQDIQMQDVIRTSVALLEQLKFANDDGLLANEDAKTLAQQARARLQQRQSPSGASVTEDALLDHIITQSELHFNELLAAKALTNQLIEREKLNVGRGQRTHRKVRKIFGGNVEDDLQQLQDINYLLTKAINVQRIEPASRARKEGMPQKRVKETPSDGVAARSGAYTQYEHHVQESASSSKSNKRKREESKEDKKETQKDKRKKKSKR